MRLHLMPQSEKRERERERERERNASGGEKTWIADLLDEQS